MKHVCLVHITLTNCRFSSEKAIFYSLEIQFQIFVLNLIIHTVERKKNNLKKKYFIYQQEKRKCTTFSQQEEKKTAD